MMLLIIYWLLTPPTKTCCHKCQPIFPKLAGESCGLKQTIKSLESRNMELEEQVQQLDKLSSEKEGEYMT